MMQGLGGLQSLIARGMRNPTQRASIPPGMQALIQAQQALKQTAAPVTSGGIPTIAGQTEQAIQQHLQPSAPQMGEPQTQVLGQGIPQAAQMAGIAAQQQQAQQQQALQQAMQMAQQQSQPDQAQPMARGGIARLPADNMARMEQYAHGGVLGFSEEKLVPKPNDSDASKSESVETPNSQLETESTLVSPRSRFPSSGTPKGLTPEKIEQIKSDYKKELGVGASPGQYRRGAGGVPVALTEEEKAAATEAALKKQRAGRESKQYTGEYRPSTASVPIISSPEEVAQQETQRLLRSHPSPEWNIDSLLAQKGAARAVAPSAPTTQRVAVQPQKGIAAGITEPTAAEQFGIAQQMVPENPLRQKILDTGEQILAKQKNRPDIEGQGIAALQQYEQERLRQLEEQKGGDFWRRLGALGRDFYERGSNDRLGRIDDLIAARNSESNKASLASKEMELKLRDAAHQKEIGNLEAYKKTMEEVASLDEKRTGHMINAAQVGAHLAGQKYTAQMNAASSAATNATQLEIARMHLMASLMQPSEQKRIDDLTKSYILKITGGKPPTPDQYIEAMKNAMEDVRGASQAGSRDIKAQTEANKQLDAFKTSMEYVTKTPTEQQALLRNKQAELERQYPGAIFGTGAGSDLLKKADAIVKGGR